MQIELSLLVVSILFFVSILVNKAGYRFGVPALLLFLAVGMLFGSDGFGIQFNNVHLAQTIGTVALCIILFSGGMDTKIADIRPVLWQGITLATLGVLLTAVITGVAIWLILGKTNESVAIGLLTSLLLAATMSSTDSASVFSILRSKGLCLKDNLRPMLELESGSNDPMAYVLTLTLIGFVKHSGSVSGIWVAVVMVLMQLTIGILLGFVLGKLLVYIINKLNISNESLYPILVLTACIFIFSVTYFLKGNSYLAVYIGGLVIGNAKVVHKRSILRFFDGFSWLSQLAMFLTLGLLVNPHELVPVLIPGLIVSFVMIFVSRPLSVLLCLLPFKMPFRNRVFVSWVGLRGAVPIIFAIMTLAADVPHARLLFNIVFVCTLVSLIVQGTSLPLMARWLSVVENPKALHKPTHFDIDLPDEIKSVATEIVVTSSMLADGNRIMDIGIPENTLVIMIKRDNGFFVPTGKTPLMVNDKMLVITDDNDMKSQRWQNLNV